MTRLPHLQAWGVHCIALHCIALLLNRRSWEHLFGCSSAGKHAAVLWLHLRVSSITTHFAQGNVSIEAEIGTSSTYFFTDS